MPSWLLHRVTETVASTALWHLGRLRRLQRRPVARILTYHNVTDEPDYGLSHPVSVFARQMRFLAEHYRVVSFSDVVAMIDGTRPWIDRAVAITFDDGYEDNCRIAWPILREHQFSATVFLTTDYIGAGRPIWTNELRHVMLNTPRVSADLPEALGGGSIALPAGDAATRLSAASDVMFRLHDYPPTARDRFVRQLLDPLDVATDRSSPQPSALRILDWDQVREMADEGHVEFGSHGCSHAIISRCGDDVLRHELSHSKAVIERELGRPVRHFAYPNGARGDWDERAIRMLSALGYEAAVINCRGLADAGAERYAIPRVGYNGAHGPTFAKRIEAVDFREALRELRAPG